MPQVDYILQRKYEKANDLLKQLGKVIEKNLLKDKARIMASFHFAERCVDRLDGDVTTPLRVVVWWIKNHYLKEQHTVKTVKLVYQSKFQVLVNLEFNGDVPQIRVNSVLYCDHAVKADNVFTLTIKDL